MPKSYFRSGSSRKCRVGKALGVGLLWLVAAGCMSSGGSGMESSERPAQVSQNVSAKKAPGTRAIIRRTNSTVEIEVTSDQPFSNAAIPPVLVIGDNTFGRSRTPVDGRQDTVIFVIDAADFDKLPDGGNVTVGYLGPNALVAAPVASSARRAAMAADTVSAPKIRADRVVEQRPIGLFSKNTLEVKP